MYPPTTSSCGDSPIDLLSRSLWTACTFYSCSWPRMAWNRSRSCSALHPMVMGRIYLVAMLVSCSWAIWRLIMRDWTRIIRHRSMVWALHSIYTLQVQFDTSTPSVPTPPCSDPRCSNYLSALCYYWIWASGLLCSWSRSSSQYAPAESMSSWLRCRSCRWLIRVEVGVGPAPRQVHMAVAWIGSDYLPLSIWSVSSKK